MLKMYSIILCLLTTSVLLILLTYPVKARDKSLSFAITPEDDIYYVQYEWTALDFNNLSYFIQFGQKTDKHYSFTCGKLGLRYYPGVKSIQGFYMGGYYNFFSASTIEGYVSERIIPGRCL